MKRIILQFLLICAAAGLAYLIWDAIRTPIDFKKEQKSKYAEVVANLKDIRKAQLAFKDVNGKFCGNWDSLINFVKTDSLPQIRKEGMLNDSMIEAGLDEKAALKKGLIVRDTIKVSALENIFGAGYPIDDLKYIPNTEKDTFTIAQTVITTGSGVSVPVFECRAHNNQILSQLKAEYEQQIINLNEQSRMNDRYPGLKVGSIVEPNNNAGNWE